MIRKENNSISEKILLFLIPEAAVLLNINSNKKSGGVNKRSILSSLELMMKMYKVRMKHNKKIIDRIRR